MKIKRFFMIMLLVSIFTITTDVAARNNKENKIPEFPETNSLNNRYFSYFISELYDKEINEAIQSYYKSEGITASGYGPYEKPDNGMASIYFGNDFSNKFSYVLKISLIPTTADSKVLGRDTLYFAVEPRRHFKKNLPKEYPPIKLIKYEHKEPSKK
jgi:hypothetical protein